MMFWDKLTEFVFDERKKISSKAALIFLALIGVLFVDNYIGFSYNYSLSNKIDNIKELNSIINDPKCDEITKLNAIKLRKETIERESFFEFTCDYISENLNYSEQKLQSTKINESNILTIRPNNFFFHFTSSGTFYLIALIMFPLMFFSDKTSSVVQRISMSLILTLMFLGMGVFLYWICGLIPMILESSWFLNYFVNAVIQGIIVYVIFKFAPR